ncbi:hypothetical protein Rhopal_001495-T1 [Rhodotorula paludigena]|uniref:Uncharacterized protein n=1 Tax=Rhodotorula paludigena TaxID=86838 RepID=A0AAV5GF73_9BASI|nr:hypothetical protein Rhopal_001495-T1 [Rhodotorula paludigena]
MAPVLPPALNDDPFVEPAFLAGLEAAGYLQRLDTSEARITARYQHALTKMQFASHSEEFLTRAGVKKVHRSTVQFFSEDPTPHDPFVHVMVGSLPPSRQSLVTPRGCETSGWTPIGSPDEADGTIHFTVSHPGFWPVTVVFDANSNDLGREDNYASIRAQDDESDSDPEAYLGAVSSGRGRRGSYAGRGSYGGEGTSYGGAGSAYGRSSSRRRTSGYDSGAGDYDGYDSRGAGGSGRRASSRSRAYDAYDDDAAASDADVYNSRSAYGGTGTGRSRRNSMASRRGSMSGAGLDEAMERMSMGGGRASRASRRDSYRSGY